MDRFRRRWTLRPPALIDDDDDDDGDNPPDRDEDGPDRILAAAVAVAVLASREAHRRIKVRDSISACGDLPIYSLGGGVVRGAYIEEQRRRDGKGTDPGITRVDE